MCIERRRKVSKTEVTLEELTIAQEVILVNVFQLGFSLKFTRKWQGGVLAVANKGKYLMSITPSGVIKYQASIEVRE